MKITTDTGLTFDLHGPALAAIALFRSRDETRRNLYGVRVEPLADGGALLVATDGHKLAVYRDGTATAKRPITLKIDKPVTGQEKFYFCEENTDDYVTWRGAIPPASTAIENPWLIVLDAKHLGVFAAAAKKLGSLSHLKIARFKINEKKDCYLVDFDDPDFYGLLMSLIIPRDYAPNFRPAFLDAAPPLAEAGKEDRA